MKKLFILVGCISLIHFSCHKNLDPGPITHKKPGLSKPDGERVSFKVSDMYSKLSAIKRRIDIINQKTNVVLGKMFITLCCKDSNDNLYRKINYEPEKFSGQITFESSHLFEFTKKILNGKLIKEEKPAHKEIDNPFNNAFELEPKLDPVSDPSPDPGNIVDAICSVAAIESCAKTTVDDMYWLDFARCAIIPHYCLTRAFGNCTKILCR